MSGGILLGIAAACAAAYSTSQKMASGYLSPIFSMLISNSVVFILGIIIFLSQKAAKQELLFDKKGVIFAVLVGVFATGIEMFAVWAYSKNLPIISASIISSMVGTVLTIGFAIFIFHESITPIKVVAFLMAVCSGIILGLAK